MLTLRYLCPSIQLTALCKGSELTIWVPLGIDRFKGIFFSLYSKIYCDQRRLKGVKKKNKLTQFVLNFEKSFPVAMGNWIRKH